MTIYFFGVTQAKEIVYGEAENEAAELLTSKLSSGEESIIFEDPELKLNLTPVFLLSLTTF